MILSIEQIFLQAVQLHQQGRLHDAKTGYENVLKQQPAHAQACYLLGVANAQEKKFIEAEEWIQKSLRLEPDNPAALCNLGNVQRETLQFKSAAHSYTKALQISPQLPEAHHNLGITYREMGQINDAIRCFERAIALRPDYTLAHCNLSQVFHEAHDQEKAFHHAHTALEQQPQSADAYVRLGDALNALKRKQEAISAYLQALQFSPYNADASIRLVNIYIALEEYVKAHTLVKALLASDPSLLHKDTWWTQWILIKSKLCDWKDWDDLRHPLEGASQTDIVINPFLSITQSNSPVVLKQVASQYALKNYAMSPHCDNADCNEELGDGRLVVGYFSADFRNHPISFLMAELFELHDRKKFKIICFSYGIEDEFTRKIRHACEEFIDVRGWDDDAIVALAHEKKMNMAVDLGGYTVHSKLGIFAKRLAPIQTSYLGYLGTLGVDFIDYLIADETIIPSEFQNNYTEKIAYLPCYQVNDSRRKIADKIFTRSELGLPKHGVVFCCFNNTFKCNPGTCKLWMRILSGVPQSTMFLYAENDIVENNLRAQAKLLGVNPARLVFGKRISVPEYLARYKVADLFLDTFPYNAGTTASDALWAGVPVLTRTGDVFASRVAGSLLNAMGLPELITDNAEDYVLKAIELGNHPSKLAEIKAKLAHNIPTTDLFNTYKFARSIEALFAKMHERHLSGLSPDVIKV
jgi:predicted O-linked N-acetylglucosamine transferase (SPINDLY family)